MLRLIIAPSVATLLLVGGVYWMRLQAPVGSAALQQASIMQVHLLPSPRPAPVPEAAATLSATDSAASRADIAPAEPAPATFDALAVVPRPRASASADLPPPSVMAAPSKIDAPADAAALRFQQALVQHVARYQRYPDAAAGQHLKGKVDAQFVMTRNGALLGVWVKTSSGHSLLDQEAVDAIRRAQPLPPIPPGLPDRLNIHVQLVFEPS